MPESKLFLLPKVPARRHQVPNNLPIQSTPLIGRGNEVEDILHLLSTATDQEQSASLVTLTGPGGVGKTRLALQIAEEALDEFEDGVYFVELASINDSDLVVPAIAGTLQLRELPGKSLESALIEHLGSKRILLILDNFEQVMPARAILPKLGASCPDLKVLVTSRAPLRLQAEREYQVLPLSVPELREQLSTSSASGYGAVTLFVQRARSIAPDFELTGNNVRAIAEVCIRVDGLPLAIELVAAHARLLSPQAMLTRLANPLRLLRGGAREAPTRQKTIKDTIEWSYNLLSSKEQRLFRRLSVCAGAFSLSAAEAVCNETGNPALAPDSSEAIDVLEGLEALIDSSLVRRLGQTGEEDRRLTMLQTVREYAWEQLEANGESGIMQLRHAGYYLWLGEKYLSKDHYQVHEIEFWLALVKSEESNLRAALTWLLKQETSHASAKALRMLRAYAEDWQRIVQTNEYLGWLEKALAQLDPAESELRIWAGRKGCTTALQQADYPRAKSWAEQTLEVAREANDEWQVTELLNILGHIAALEDDFATARLLMENALEVYRKLNKDFEIAGTLMNLGSIASFQRDYTYAETLLSESLSRLRIQNSAPGVLHATLNLGHAQWHLGKFQQARTVLLESLELAQTIEAPRMAADALTNLSSLALAELDENCSQARLNLTLKQIARLCGLASSLLEKSSRRLEPVSQKQFDDNVSIAREKLSDAEFASAWEEGRSMDLAQALLLATQDYIVVPENTPKRRGRPRKQAVGGLTNREHDVAALLAQGMTNPEMAAQLVLSVRTVEAHVANTMQKLGLHTRAELAAWAVRESIASEPT